MRGQSIEVVVFEMSSGLYPNRLIDELNRFAKVVPPVRLYQEYQSYLCRGNDWFVGVVISNIRFAIVKNETALVRAASKFAKTIGEKSLLFPE